MPYCKLPEISAGGGGGGEEEEEAAAARGGGMRWESGHPGVCFSFAERLGWARGGEERGGGPAQPRCQLQSLI